MKPKCEKCGTTERLFTYDGGKTFYCASCKKIK